MLGVSSSINALADDITVVAVSKTFPVDSIRDVYRHGYREFGENRVQEMLSKQAECQDLPIHWHLLGPLQTNKVRQVVGKVHLFHALDSIRLYREIVRQCELQDCSMACLIQINISLQSSKHGVLPDRFDSFVSELGPVMSERCPVLGLMCIGSDLTVTSEDQVRQEFERMRSLFESVQFNGSPHFHRRYLSMGMSADWQIALQYGSNMIRLGRAIFGQRSDT